MASAVSAVIVNYNTAETLIGLVKSLLDERGVARVIVVDNASRDGSPERLALEITDSRLSLVRNLDNRGFAAGCNQGAARANSPCLLFINPDCRFEAGALTRLLAALQARPDAGMAGPLLLGPDGREQRGCRRYLPDPRRALLRVLGLGGPGADGRVGGFDLAGTPLPAAAAEVEAISGACMLVKREVYARVGGWDEGYFLHCEDLDLCMRFALQGAKVLFVPDAVVDHVQGVSSRGRNVFVSWHKHRGMWRYYGKFQRPRSPAWLTALVWVGIWSRFLLLLPGAWFASLGPRHRASHHAG